MVSAFFLLILVTVPAWASDHTDYVSGEYADTMSVTRDCLNCHTEQGADFMKTAHWLWKGPTPFLIGHEDDTHIGKINLMNNF
jgi:hypothetical protein